MRARAYSRKAFTLIEIMIVVAVVSILSWLAMVVVTRVRDRAVRSMLQNNLRQLYQAKEYYFAETGEVGTITASKLLATGYLSKSQFDRLFVHGSLETKLGWHYSTFPIKPNEPTQAYRGPKPSPSSPATGNVMYYPGPPAVAQLSAGQSPGGGDNPPTIVPTETKPPVTLPPTTTRPDTTPAVVIPPDAGKPADAGNLANRDTSIPSNPGNTQPANPDTSNPATHHGPGNSDFGHSHNQGNNNANKHN